ncbi:MAG: hypothetical protein JNK05_28940 [Myxococcales bacterium]|nr:hypothetical protein [Myxococcales bacterium]
MPVEDSGLDPNVAYCAPCASLSSGAVDQALVLRFASEIDPIVAAGAPGGAPITMPGALGAGVSPGVYARLAAATNNALGAREIVTTLSARIESLSRESTLVPPLGPSVGGSDNLATLDGLGEACAGALALRGFTADPTVPQAVSAASADVIPVLDGTANDFQQFSIDRINDPRWLAAAARMLGACGALVQNNAAVASGLELVDRTLQTQAGDGAFADVDGRFDTNRQANVLLALMDTLKSVPQSACAARMRRLQLGVEWLAGRVTAMGQVDSSNSRTTCDANGEVFDRRLGFLALAGGAALFESAPDGALTMKALSVSAFALANPGGPTCFP